VLSEAKTEPMTNAGLDDGDDAPTSSTMPHHSWLIRAGLSPIFLLTS
jgi:hypothetical protein